MPSCDRPRAIQNRSLGRRRLPARSRRDSPILSRRGHVRPARRSSDRGRRLLAGGSAAPRSRAGFERVCTIMHLHGGGLEGVGEDVVYDAEDHVALQEAGPGHRSPGRYSLGEFCELIDSLDLFPVAPQREVSRLYRVWAFHSAALDLALRQAGQAAARRRCAASRRRCATSARCGSASRRRWSRCSCASRWTRRCASSSTRRARGRRS